jgi:hypothetical protein
MMMGMPAMIPERPKGAVERTIGSELPVGAEMSRPERAARRRDGVSVRHELMGAWGDPAGMRLQRAAVDRGAGCGCVGMVVRREPRSGMTIQMPCGTAIETRRGMSGEVGSRAAGKTRCRVTCEVRSPAAEAWAPAAEMRGAGDMRSATAEMWSAAAEMRSAAAEMRSAAAEMWSATAHVRCTAAAMRRTARTAGRRRSDAGDTERQADCGHAGGDFTHDATS